MEDLRVILLTFSGIFAFAFGMAWVLPLFSAGESSYGKRQGDETKTFVDLLLICFDCIPIFWILRTIEEAPESCRAAKNAWDNQQSIRITFWSSLISTLVFVVVWFLLR